MVVRKQATLLSFTSRSCVPTTPSRSCTPTTPSRSCTPTAPSHSCTPTTPSRSCTPTTLSRSCTPTTPSRSCTPTTPSRAEATPIITIHDKEAQKTPNAEFAHGLLPEQRIPRIQCYPRSFVADWYGQFSWLEYCAQFNAAFCYPCRIYRSKLIHFIKSMFQKHEIVGPHIWQYIISLDLWSSVILDIGLKCTIGYLRNFIFKFFTRVGHAQIS